MSLRCITFTIRHHFPISPAITNPIPSFCSPIALASDDWRTLNHSPGYCATYDICGHRKESATDYLSCAANLPARPLPSSHNTTTTTTHKLQQVCPQLANEIGTDGAVCCTERQLDILQQQIQQARIFLIGCPACSHNFQHFFCLMTCSPNQATFINVTSVQESYDDDDVSDNNNAVQEMDVFLSPTLGNALYDSCANVIFAPVNLPAMNFVGGGAKNFQEWVDFLGLLKDKRTPPQGSPFQINFPPVDPATMPSSMEAMNGTMAPCGQGALACSCGDCPQAESCRPPAPPPPRPPPAVPPSFPFTRGPLRAGMYRV